MVGYEGGGCLSRASGGVGLMDVFCFLGRREGAGKEGKRDRDDGGWGEGAYGDL